MKDTLVIGIDPDMSTPAFAAVVLPADPRRVVEFKNVWVGRVDFSSRVFADWMLRGALKPLALGCVAEIAVEMPDITHTRGRNIRQQNIVELAYNAGECAQTAGWFLRGMTFVPNFHKVLPQEWKGQVPKLVNQRRTCAYFGWGYEERVSEKRSGGLKKPDGYCVPHLPELAGVSRSMDWKHGMDAVGIALWLALRLRKSDAIQRAVGEKKLQFGEG